MKSTINAKELRASLPDVVARVRRGARYVVIYRSRPAFQIVPMDDSEKPNSGYEEDSLYLARPLGRSTDGKCADDHDAILYGK